MNKQNLMLQPAQPVNRVTTGQLPPELFSELSDEEAQSLNGGFFKEALKLATGYPVGQAVGAIFASQFVVPDAPERGV